MTTDSLGSRQRQLEEAFFIERDKELIARLREMRQMEETRQNLAKVSGISNEAVLNKLVSLNIRAETVASLAVIPLVEVAWADGQVDAKERAAILKAVEGSFAKESDIDHALLAQWLTHRPPAELMTAWTDYVKALCRQLTASERAALKKDIIDHATIVAKAAGSFLGLTSGVSKEEQAMLGKLGQAFDAGGETTAAK
jgi:uncharacterized tellurite resistance protein B-like protein